jgi:amidohydrolase
MDIKERIQQKADEYYEEVIRIRRHLHMHPELSFGEAETSSFIRSLLDKWGILYRYPFVGTGLVAEITGKDPEGPVIALRSDMDALPIEEQTGLEYSSRNKGVMHACGHDIHMASLLGSIMVLKELKDLIRGRILFIFQPGEEKLPGGAKLMMEEGIFDQVRPDMIVAQHVLPEMNTGTVGFRPGPYMASSDEIYITVRGQGGHGALPEKINDPVLMASHMLITLQQEINRKSPKGVPTVLSFGKVIADGAVNVIPDEVHLEGTFRTMNESWRKEAHQLIARVTRGIADSMGGEAELEVRHGYPVLKNDPELTARSRSFAIDLLGREHVEDMDIRMTAEDFGWFSHAYPSMLYRLGVKRAETEDILPLHTNRFRADESALKTGMTMLSWLAVNLLK